MPDHAHIKSSFLKFHWTFPCCSLFLLSFLLSQCASEKKCTSTYFTTSLGCWRYQLDPPPNQAFPTQDQITEALSISCISCAYSAPSSPSHHGHPFHQQMHCNGHGDVAQVLWECSWLYETQKHDEKGSWNTRHGFVFKCLKCLTPQAGWPLSGVGFFRQLLMPASPWEEAEPCCCRADLIPFFIYLILFCWRKAVLHKDVYLPGCKKGHGLRG